MSVMKILPILSGAAALASVAAFLRARANEPAHLAPGVTYRAVVRISPQMPESEARDMIETNLRGSVKSVVNKRSSTFIDLQFENVTPHTVSPGETLLQVGGRKAVLVSIKEV